MGSRSKHHETPGQHHSHKRVIHKMTPGHIGKLFVFYLLLFLMIFAFAGFITGDWLPGGGYYEIVILVGVVVVAVIATIVHGRGRKWTSVDDMAERL